MFSFGSASAGVGVDLNLPDILLTLFQILFKGVNWFIDDKYFFQLSLLDVLKMFLAFALSLLYANLLVSVGLRLRVRCARSRSRFISLHSALNQGIGLFPGA